MAILLIVAVGPGWFILYAGAVALVACSALVARRFLPSQPPWIGVGAVIIAVNVVLLIVLAGTGWLFSSSSSSSSSGSTSTSEPTGTTEPGSPSLSPIAPTDLSALTAAAQLAQSSQDSTEAVTLWQQVVAIDPTVSNLLALAQVQTATSASSGAIVTLYDALTQSPHDPVVAYELGLALQTAGGVPNIAAGLGYLQQASSEDPGNSTYRTAVTAGVSALKQAAIHYPEASIGGGS